MLLKKLPVLYRKYLQTKEHKAGKNQVCQNILNRQHGY